MVHSIIFILCTFFIVPSFCWVSGYHVRREFTVTNKLGSTVTDVHVSIELNTLQMISEGKIGSDCFDIKFTESDDTPIDYWMEGGCRTSRTTFWVKVPQLLGSEEVSFWMYSYNPTQTYYSGLSWGNSPNFNRFGFFSEVSCASPLTHWGAIENRLILGAATEDTSTSGNDTNHTHRISSLAVTCDQSTSSGKYARGITENNLAYVEHTHVVTLRDDTLSGDAMPRSRNFVGCYATTSPYLDGGIPSGAMAAFETSATSVDWPETSNVNSGEEYVRACADGSQGGFVGNKNHSHTMQLGNADVQKMSSSGHWRDEAGGGQQLPRRDHKHTSIQPCVTNPTDNEPPYRKLFFRSANGTQRFISGMISFQYCNGSCANPPLGWDRYTDNDGVLLRGSSSSGTSAADTHDHGFACTTDFESITQDSPNDLETGSSAKTVSLRYHVHNVQGTVPSSRTVPYHVKLRFIKRKSEDDTTVTLKGEEHVCYGISFNDPTVCSNQRGTCDDYNTCHCLEGYFGNECQVTECYGDLNNRTAYCSNERGDCISHDKCRCHPGYYGAQCQITDCYGDLNNGTEYCSKERGLCVEYNKCRCLTGYYGAQCQITDCLGHLNNGTEYCSKERGDCISHNKCQCHTGYYGDECQVTTCDGVFSNLTSAVCHGRGGCLTKDTCSCANPMFNSSSFCRDCQSGYFGEDCRVTKCFDFFSNQTSQVCSGHGSCWPLDTCSCTNSSGPECEVWSCGNVMTNVSNSNELCSGHGTCEEYNVCDCSKHYSGDVCQYFSCFGVDSTDVNSICSKHGSCVAFDLCICQFGYESSSGIVGGTCDHWTCGPEKHPKYTRGGCNNRGNCTSYDECDCDEGFSGRLCGEWSCGGFDKDLIGFVCSGNGDCEGPNNCVCESGSTGENCETNIYLLTVMTPILATSTIFCGIFVICGVVCASIVVAVVVIVFVCCLFVCVFFVFCSLVICCACCVSMLMCSQRNRLKKFGKLKNFDVLLKEQEIENDDSIAHVRINKSLFEIPMKELKLIAILGEGGSNSIVYRAKWRTMFVAFKCFRTRAICCSQQSFDEFEREVEVLASISHPHIIRYFGSSIEEPRIGIVMEFCENGDLEKFIQRYESTKKSRYPFEQKMRMVLETSRAMDYLHSRLIIHRDLKLENVLLDSNESCKLMDFGLSKIVDRMSVQKTSRIGTSYYMSPEIVNSGKYDEKTDVFSMAIFIFILLTEEICPYGSPKDCMRIELRVANNPNLRPKLEMLKNVVPQEHQDLIIEIVERCWSHYPEKRLTMNEICCKIGEGMKDLPPPKTLFQKEVELGAPVMKKKEEKNKSEGVVVESIIEEDETVFLEEENKELKEKIKRVEEECQEEIRRVKEESQERIIKVEEVVKEKNEEILRMREELEKLKSLLDQSGDS